MKRSDPAIWGIGPSCQPNQAVQCSTCTRNVQTSASSLMLKMNANCLRLIFTWNFQQVNSSLSPFGAKDTQCNRLAGIRASMSLKIRLTHITEGNDIYRFIRVYPPKKQIQRYSYKTLLLLFCKLLDININASGECFAGYMYQQVHHSGYIKTKEGRIPFC